MNISNFNWVDCAFFAFVLIGALHGLLKGLSRVLGELFGAAVAVFIARAFYNPLGALFSSWWTSLQPELARLLAVLALLLLAWISVRLFQRGLRALMTFSFRGWAERILGAVAGAAWYAIICLVLMWAISFINNSTIQRAVLYNSTIGRLALPYLQTAYNQLAEKASLLSSTLPIGVETEPRAILPPNAENWINHQVDRAVNAWDVHAPTGD